MESAADLETPITQLELRESAEREVENLEAALGELSHRDELSATPIGKRILARAGMHLLKRHERMLGLKPFFDSEQAVLAHLKGTAQELNEASQALLKSAERMKSKGDGFGANQAHLAYLRAHRAAQDLVES